jgi:hypothetical protein
MWLFSGAPDDPEDDTVIERHGAEEIVFRSKEFDECYPGRK